MAPRTILYTGKGGVGKTSVAAATARRVAAGGIDTIVLSTDPAHSLADSLQTPVGGEPTQVGERLWAQQVAAQDEMERNWAAVQDWLGEMLLERGVDRISAEELTVPPGLDELFSLLQIKRHHEEGRFGCVIVDCAPTGETLRLLSFPDVARWWLQKVFPQSPQIMAAARPLARADARRLAAGRRRPRRRPAAGAQPHRDERDPARHRARLGAPGDDARPHGRRRGAAHLHLPEPLRLPDRRGGRQPRLPRGGRARTSAPGASASSTALDEVQSAFAPVPVLRAPYFGEEVVGAEMLDRLGAPSSTARDPGAVLHERLTQELVVGADAARSCASTCRSPRRARSR